MEDLDEYDLKVLYELCRTGKSQSSVALAAEVFSDAPATEADLDGKYSWYWLVMQKILEDLNERGLVTYRLPQYEGDASKVGSDIYVHIRPTMKAYTVAGVTFKYAHFVGQRHRPGLEPPKKKEDRTDFRTHNYDAVGVGPVECMQLDDHILTYEDHADKHWGQYDELHAKGVV